MLTVYRPPPRGRTPEEVQELRRLKDSWRTFTRAFQRIHKLDDDRLLSLMIEDVIDRAGPGADGKEEDLDRDHD